MEIVVSFKKIWGKELFYPVSDDAKLLARITGRPTLLKCQLRICKEAGWKVTLVQETLNLEDYLKVKNERRPHKISSKNSALLRNNAGKKQPDS